MSYYFRPPNSREQNLFIIRSSIDDLRYNNFTNKTLNSTAYTSPANVFLPAGFSFSYNDTSYAVFTIDYTNAKYEVPPTVSFQMKNDLLTPNNNGPWYTSILSVSNTQVVFYIFTLEVTQSQSGYVNTPSYPIMDNNQNSLSGIGIQIQIIGRTTTGPTFAIANQGWTYVESTNPSNDTIYSAMPVGTNGVIPSLDLTIGGSFGYLGGAGNGGIPSTTTLQNYTPTEAVANIGKYYFFPIKLGSLSETMTLPVVTVIGQEIVLLLNQTVTTSYTLTILTTNTTLATPVVLQNEGDMVKFVALNKDGVGSRWVKVNTT